MKLIEISLDYRFVGNWLFSPSSLAFFYKSVVQGDLNQFQIPLEGSTVSLKTFKKSLSIILLYKVSISHSKFIVCPQIIRHLYTYCVSSYQIRILLGLHWNSCRLVVVTRYTLSSLKLRSLQCSTDCRLCEGNYILRSLS